MERRTSMAGCYWQIIFNVLSAKPNSSICQFCSRNCCEGCHTSQGLENEPMHYRKTDFCLPGGIIDIKQALEQKHHE